jgi:ligand-binding sensor domain-containing protein
MRVFKKLFGWLLATLLIGGAAGVPFGPDAAVHAADAGRWTALSDTVFEYLARDNELPNSTAPTALAEDGEGFLWVGTQNGLARWDGYHFRSYKADPATPGTLPDNLVRQLHTDTRGRLWIATNSGGLARYDRDRDRFVTYAAGPDGLSSASLRDIVDDGSGGVWIATDSGLDHLRADWSRGSGDVPSGDSGQFEHFRHSDNDPTSLPDNRVRALFRDRDGGLWVGTAAGLARRESGSTRFVPVPLAHGSSGLTQPEGKVAVPWTFYQDSDGRVWVGTIREGVYVLNVRERGMPPALEGAVTQPLVPTEGVHAITEVRPGEIWLGTDGHGIVSVNTRSFQTQRILHDPTVMSSLADDSVQALHTDRSGLVWVATNRGISHYNSRQAAVYTVFGGSSRPGSLSDSDVDSVLVMPDGRVWLGLGSQGIDVLEPLGMRVASLRPDPQHPASALPKDYVNALVRGPDGDVYVGTEQGIYRADRRTAWSACPRPCMIPPPRSGRCTWSRAYCGSGATTACGCSMSVRPISPVPTSMG